MPQTIKTLVLFVI